MYVVSYNVEYYYPTLEEYKSWRWNGRFFCSCRPHRRDICHCCSTCGYNEPWCLGSVLPLEMKQLIVVRVPFSEIIRLRYLFKKWKMRIDTDWSLFRQECVQAFISMFALIIFGNRDGTFRVNAFHQDTNRWHAIKNPAPGHQESVKVCACEGGLSCFLFRITSSLEGAWRIPYCGESCDRRWEGASWTLKFSRATGVVEKLSVNYQTKRYKVIVVIAHFSESLGLVYG